MIYLVIQGGCGNQFFQYAFARYLQSKTGQEIGIDWRNVIGQSTLWNNGENTLQFFNTVRMQDASTERKPVNWILFKIVCTLFRLLRLEKNEKRRYKFRLFCAKHLARFGVYYFGAGFYPFSIAKSKNIIINGYFEFPKYFENIDEDICRELTVDEKYPVINKEMYDKINQTESVCITINRRNINDSRVSTIYSYSIQYFYNAIQYINQMISQAVFFVFSDDIQWCCNNLKVDVEMYFEKGNDPIWEKMRLMSACKHFIIHNSTFSWWAQHLSKNSNKIVIAPEVWVKFDYQPIDIYEDNWIYLTSDGKIVNEHK